MPLTIDSVLSEVASGLPNERKAIEDAYANADYYNGENRQYIEVRDGEDPRSFERRRKRVSMLTYEVIEALTRHLYNPGPTRKLADPAADQWYQDIGKALDLNAYWQEADKLCTLNDWCAFQAALSDDPERPVELHLWGREELCVWTDPDNARRAAVVCTIDRYDAQTRYRVWDAEEVATLITGKWEEARPAKTRERVDGTIRAAKLVSREPHGYGRLPFSFVHFRPPIRAFHTPGIGTAIRECNAVIDAILCDLSESVQFYARPIIYALNVREDWRPVIRAGGFLKLPQALDAPMGETGNLPEPRLEALHVPIDIEGLWNDVQHQVDHVLENFGVPKAAVRMEQQSAASGAAIIQEQAPLIERSRKRRPMFQRYETDLAKLLLWVGSLQTGDTALEAASQDPGLTLTWGEPQIDLPGQDRDNADRAALELGVTSRVEILMARDGLTREEASNRLIQLAEDEQVFTAAFPSGGPLNPDMGQQQGDPIDGQGQDQQQAPPQAQADGGQAQAQG